MFGKWWRILIGCWIRAIAYVSLSVTIATISTGQEIIDGVCEIKPVRSADSLIYAPTQTLNAIMRQMAKVDMSVGSRYHNIVCALKMGKPAISISYARKTDLLLGEMGLGEFCHHIESFDVELLKKHTEEMLSRRVELKPKILEDCSRFEDELRGLENMLSTLIHGDPKR